MGEICEIEEVDSRSRSWEDKRIGRKEQGAEFEYTK